MNSLRVQVAASRALQRAVTGALLGLLAALTNGAQAMINKDLTGRWPARQLIGILYLLNCAVLLPFVPFADWVWSPAIVVLHLVSVALMAVTAICVWDMFDKGAASATTTASALSPIPTAIGLAILVPDTLHPLQLVASVIVVVGVLWALQGAFSDMGRRGVILRVLGASIGNGLLTVLTRMLGDDGVGVVETYVVRTGLAAILMMALIPPRDIPRSATPRLFFRSVLVTVSFVFIIIGAQQGSPLVVQTLVATTPLFVLVFESFRERTMPPPRALAAALLVIVGVLIVLVV